MTSPQHQRWLASGAHWRPAVPIAELQHAIQVTFTPPADTLGTIGDTAHLDAEPPEDHTPYSETGWPGPTPYGVVTALDYNGPGWQSLFRYLIAERRAGRMLWIKYINFQGNHHRWEPDYSVTPSSDWAGHGHLSIRSDWCDRSTGLSVQQLTGGSPGPTPPPPPTGDPLGDKIMSSWQTLVSGSTGQRVHDLQALLNAHGEGLVEDGLFGPLTLAAVQRFQVNHHVANSVRADGTGDGQAGPQTMIALLDM